MMKPIKKIALLHSLCGVGKASMTNMLPILSAMGIEACPIPTVLLSTHTGGYNVPVIQSVEPEYIRLCGKHFRENQISFDLIFVGYLGKVDMVESVVDFLDCFPNAKVILDPIMGDNGRYYQNIESSYVDAYKRLISYADVIIPNLTEACLLTHTSYQEMMTNIDIEILAAVLNDIGAKQSIITSIPGNKGNKDIALCTCEEKEILSLPQIAHDYHGTGDVFDAVFVGGYLQGNAIKDSVLKAHDFVCECIRSSIQYDYDKREGLLLEKSLSLLV